MNIDSLSKLIESTDISSFRTLSLIFLDIIGFSSVHFCDGPYDGGKDFKIYEKGIKLAIQISTEKDWRKKIEQEIVKIQKNYNINNVLFVSSRRIPENSFQKLASEMLIKNGVHITRYDNQSISSEFIKNNKVGELLELIGIKNFYKEQKKEFSPKHEAISSLLLFGDDTKIFRDAIFDSLIKSYLSTYVDGITREKLLEFIISDIELSTNQEKLVNSHIDRLLQQGIISKQQDVILLKNDELKKFLGLKSAGQQDYIQAQKTITNLFHTEKICIKEEDLGFFFDNMTEFIITLYANQVSYLDKNIINNESYLIIRRILQKSCSEKNVDFIFEKIANTIADTAFGVRISSTALYLSLINTNSDHLLEALGGKAGAYIFLDASVTIPMICGLLFDKFSHRFGYSANLLYNLIKDHKFTAYIPDVYVEEIATHLIEACRDYIHIIKIEEDLSFSNNAFVSHYSRYKKQAFKTHLSFEDYAKIFGVNLPTVKADMPNFEFYRTRDESKNEITRLLSKYGIETVAFDRNCSKEIKNNYFEILKNKEISRPEVLVNHDAQVVQYLYSATIPSGAVKILCTWDKAHVFFRSAFNYGYDVLNPISIIDLFSLAKPKEFTGKLSALTDFAMMQSSQLMEQGSKIWDKLVSLEKENFADAELLIKAKKFKENYLSQNADIKIISSDDIAKAWESWKKN